MRRFIFKTSLFVIPFLFLFIITSFLYSKSEGPDLIRLGLIPNIYKNYRDNFTMIEDEKFVKLSTTKKNIFKIMTIGDSFSEQGANGYKNFVADNFSVLHVDRFISKNPIQTLINLCNGDFFEYYDIKFVILQNVERHLIDNCKNVTFDKVTTLKEIDSLIKNQKKDIKAHKYDFFSKTTIQFPLYSLPKFFFSHNYLSNNIVYNYDLNNNSYFSNSSDKLLFYHEDLEKTRQNNNLENCIKLNNILNDIALKLKKKNIQLIFLPAPDKYDLYYDMIVEKKNLTKPIFFDNFSTLKKEYLYINSKSILQEHINRTEDIYYYDDTHWSPIASKIIAEKFKDVINESK